MSPTIRDIARAANVSHTTVSRVLNGKGSGFISEATRQRVLEAAAAMNYTPNRAAQALATGRTGLLGIWVESLRSPDFVSIASHAVAQLKGVAQDPVVREMDFEEIASGSVAAWQVDGILAVEGLRFVKRLLDTGGSNHPPIVHMGFRPSERLDYVKVDLAAGSREAVRHLVEVGCGRIALLTNQWLIDYPGDEPRKRAYTEVLGEAGLSVEFIETPDDERNSARQVVADYVRAHGCPDGLFCVHDGIAVGASRGLRDLGVRIPEDCALVGCDGLEDTAYFDPPISTVAPPIDAMCAVAWQFLHERLGDPVRPLQQATLPSCFIARESSARPLVAVGVAR